MIVRMIIRRYPGGADGIFSAVSQRHVDAVFRAEFNRNHNGNNPLIVWPHSRYVLYIQRAYSMFGVIADVSEIGVRIQIHDTRILGYGIPYPYTKEPLDLVAKLT